MTTSSSSLSRPKSMLLLPAIAKLAGWRFKQMWRFLLVTWLGMLAMVVLACAPPLFSRVAISANLRDVTANSPDGQTIIVQVVSLTPTTTQLQRVSQQLDHILKQNGLGMYIQGTPQLVVQAPPLTMPPSNTTKSVSQADGLVLDGYDPAQAAQHTTVVQGRLPQVTNDGTIEIALTQDVANNFGLHVDSTIQTSIRGILGVQTWTLHVVGIIASKSAHDPFWLANANPFGSLYSVANGATAHNVLAADKMVRSKIASLQTLPGKNPAHLFWSYPFDLSRLDANTLTTLAPQASNLDFQIGTLLPQIQGVTFATPTGSLFELLSSYPQQIVILEIVLTFLLLLILAIILFLIGMMSNILVERQTTTIATLRSRGATQQHIFGTFVTQGILVGLTALLVGPLLAILLVYIIAQVLLSPSNQQALNVLTAHPLQAALDVKWFAVFAVLLALFVLIVALRQTSKLDIVTLRRESARTKRVPFWRRFHLDILLMFFIVVGYTIYTYLLQSSLAAQGFDDPFIYNVFKISGFIAPPFLVAAVLLLFLRLFPFILRIATFIAGKRRSAVAMLAFAQMERAPRPVARIAVLLILAISASCFLCTLMATKQVRTSNAATFAVGADFSGPLPASDSFTSLNTLKTRYSRLAGVRSATIGYQDVLDNPVGDIHISAVDADTYDHSALWTTQVSAQSLSSLTAQLAAHRSDATTHNVVYALVDTVLWQKYGLSQGDMFSLPINETGTRVHFIALGLLNYIPGTYNAPMNPDSDIGLIVDYQSYATVYEKQIGMTLSPNYLWLRTYDDTASLVNIRRTLPELQDRRLLTISNQENSVHVDIIGVLAIGIGTALILALVGTLLSSWLNTSNRLTSFALLRALGMAPRHIASLLLWEQGFIYILAFVIGFGLGNLLTFFAAPAVALLDLAGPSSQDNPFDIPPVQTVIPYLQLSLLLGGLVVICLVALLLMTRIVSRPSISQTLRLSED